MATPRTNEELRERLEHVEFLLSCVAHHLDHDLVLQRRLPHHLRVGLLAAHRQEAERLGKPYQERMDLEKQDGNADV